MENEIKKLQSMLQADPSNFHARRKLAILLSQRGFNEEALSNLQYLQKYFPEDAEIYYNLGILYEKLKDLENAEISYTKAIEISPQEDFYYNLGEVLVELKQWDRALTNFRKVLATCPNDSNCYFNIGICYYNKEEINNATDNFQKTVQLNPQDVYAHFYLGNIYQDRGLTNFAVECYNRVLEISPDYSWAYFNLGSIAFRNDNYDEAKDYLLKTIEYNKGDIEAYKLLVKIFVKLKEYEEIISILETRLTKEENGDLYYVLARVYKLIGNTDLYQKNLELSLENSYTLTFNKKIIQQEYNYFISSLKANDYEEEIEEFPDYNDREEDDSIEEYDEIDEVEDDAELDEF